jgi:putative spermidine/putrescine transport system permease protein
MKPRAPEQAWTYLWLAPGLLLMGALFVLPIAQIAWISVSTPGLGAQNYVAIATEPLYVRVLINTGVSAAGATFACLVLGYPAAYAIYRAPAQWRQALLGLVLFSYAVGTMPRVFSWLVVLGDKGLINQMLVGSGTLKQPLPLIFNMTGVLVGMTHVMLPFMTLILLGSMTRVSRQLVPAARTLGASPARAFWFVFFPLTMPGILAGTMMVLVYSLGFFVVPAVLGGAGQTTVVMAMRELALNLGLWGLASALAVVIVAISILGTAIYVRATALAEMSDRS